jgi:hypothetical protein
MVEEQHAAGFDHLKIHEGLSRETYDTIVATAKRLGMRFAGHVPDAVGVYHALESGQASIEHLDNYVETIGGPDSADDARLGKVVAARGGPRGDASGEDERDSRGLRVAIPCGLGTRPSIGDRSSRASSRSQVCLAP